MEDPRLSSCSSPLIDVLFGVTIAALFSGLNQLVGGVKVQLSDVLVVMTVFVVSLRGFATPRISPVSAIVLLSYQLVVCVSAFLVTTLNGVKECVQAILVLSFLFVLFGYYRTHSARRLLVISSSLIFATLAVNIGWHISEGYYVGWKRLNEPKTIFMLLPMLLILLSERFGKQRHALFILATVGAGFIILISGERKAYLFAIIALVIWTGAASVRYLVSAALVAPVLLAIFSLDNTGYLSRQFGSVSTALTSRIEQASTSELFDERRPGTYSDAQREFTKRLAKSMWEQEPIFGIGTGAYSAAMKRYYSVPSAFRAGIHGEFYRALYENGIVGLTLYAAFWIASGASLLFSWSQERESGGPNLNRIKLLCIVMFLIYCAFEASKGLTLVSICALPFILALRRNSARSVSASKYAMGQGDSRMQRYLYSSQVTSEANAGGTRSG